MDHLSFGDERGKTRHNPDDTQTPSLSLSPLRIGLKCRNRDGEDFVAEQSTLWKCSYVCHEVLTIRRITHFRRDPQSD